MNFNEMKKYREFYKNNFKTTLFIVESGKKLRLPVVAICAACTIYHRFFEQAKHKDYDQYLIGTTALYLASESEESPRKLRDVVNVCHSCRHKDKPLLDVDSTYWDLRDSVVNCELLMLRCLAFKLTFHNPHKYLLHYLKSIHDWMAGQVWDSNHVTQLCWTFLQDSFHTPLNLHYEPWQVATGILYLAMQTCGVVVITKASKHWWQVFWPDCSEDELQLIATIMMDFYENENRISL